MTPTAGERSRRPARVRPRSNAARSAARQLSAFLSEPDLIAADGSTRLARLDDRLLDLRRATFGTWTELAGRLAAIGRRFLDGRGQDAARYLKLFATTDAAALRALTSTTLAVDLLASLSRSSRTL